MFSIIGVSIECVLYTYSIHGRYTNLLDFELDLEGELNDGREVGARSLTWWLEPLMNHL